MNEKGIREMEQLLYAIAGLVARIHIFILSWNDSIETSFTDKELHFLVIGLFGLALICALHPLFLWLARTGHTMFITFFYVFTAKIAKKNRKPMIPYVISPCSMFPVPNTP